METLGSFDYATASLREAVTPLRMTFVREIQIELLLGFRLALLTHVGKALLEVCNQILSFAGNVERFMFALLRSHPCCQFLRRGIDETALAVHGHSRPLPALRDWDRLA
jgi:hypothetical protein